MLNDNVKEKFWNTTFTLTGRVFHPNLLKPREKKNEQTGKTRQVFDGMFAWKKDDQRNVQEIAKLNAFIGEMIGLVFPGMDPRALVIPVKDFDTYTRNDYKPNAEYLRGCKWINAESGVDFPPAVVGPNRQPVFAESELYSGRNVVFNFQLYPILPDANNRQKKIGFGINLNAVMLQDGGEKEGGARVINVDQIFGAFAGDMGMNQGGQQQGGQNYGGYNTQPANQGNGQGHAPQGTNQNGHQHHGGQTQGYQQGGNGQGAQNGASHSNQQGQHWAGGNQPNSPFTGNNGNGNNFV